MGVNEKQKLVINRGRTVDINNGIDSLTVRCFLLWHFERVRLMVSRLISARGCDKSSAPGSSSRLTFQSLAKNIKVLIS